MALVSQSYAPPGVYTQTVYNANTPQLNAAARIAVLIGEGESTFTNPNVELHRGSSATADDLVAGENVSDQANGSTRVFQLTYFPVVTGDGSGTVTNNPTFVTVTVNGVPATVIALNGKTGQLTLQSIAPAGANVVVQYYFKKTDTLIANENESAQVPAYATLAVGSQLTLTLSLPGALGNLVSLALTQASSGNGVSDALAISGAGTDAISIELRNSDNSLRTVAELAALINTGIPTQDGGYLVVATQGTNVAVAAQAATNFAGGSGPSTNTVFKTNFTPIVDGTNGGVVTTDPTKVTVLVNGVPAKVTAVNGATGLVTLANPVVYGASLEATYYTNAYQDTSDLLPNSNGDAVSSIDLVGYGPNRNDFTEGVDFVLSGNSIAWGATANTAAAQSTPGFTPFDATVITTTLVDEQVYLRLVTGVVNGKNAVYTLQDTPVDGSGLGRATDIPSLVSVYVGANPVAAAASGPVRVAQLSGDSATVTLYNPPASGQNVYASYYRSALNDHTFTLTVAVPGIPGQGSYFIMDELNQIAPAATVGTNVVANENFTNTGIVWPNSAPDLAAALGGADETVTLTFQNDSLTTVVTPAIQASLVVTDSGAVPRIEFLASTPGTGGNAVSITLVGGPTGAADAAAITVVGSAITVETVMADNVTVRTWQQIVTLFATYPVTITGAGQILCSRDGSADLTPQASSFATTHLANGAAAISVAYANRYLVTSSRTLAQAAADGRGLTGGAQTGVGVGAVGYLGQTYIDAHTAVKFTVVDPPKALSYGYTQLPSPSYTFAPGDTLTFVVSAETAHVVGTTPTIAAPGLQTKVVSTYGMNPGDTATVQTFNRAGSTPAVGEYYYVTFETEKSAADMALQLFDDVDDAYAVYGQPSATNRLSLGVQFFNQNAGDQVFACIQVPAQAGLATASDQSYIDAIQSLVAALPGSARHVNVIVPLSTSATVQQFLSTFTTKQAAPRQKAEATGFVGFDQFATAASIQALAQGIANQRIAVVTPPSLGVMLSATPTSTAVEVPVDGSFAAAAMAGLMLAPGNDVATTLTFKKVVGFTRSLVTFDDPTMNLLAVAGVTCLVDAAGALEVRHYKTTDPSNDLTSEPYVTTSADYINQSFRTLCKQFGGRKMTSDLPSTIQAVLNGQLAQWNSNDDNAIISGYGQLTVVPDATDPTTIDIAVPVKPMWSNLYINIVLSVNLAL